jgi:hypothetical protein
VEHREHRDAGAAELADPLQDGVTVGRIERRNRFVEEQQP